MAANSNKTRPIPVRLKGTVCQRLDRAASRLASNRAAIIRLAIVQLLPDIESGRLILKTTIEG